MTLNRVINKATITKCLFYFDYFYRPLWYCVGSWNDSLSIFNTVCVLKGLFESPDDIFKRKCKGIRKTPQIVAYKMTFA